VEELVAYFKEISRYSSGVPEKNRLKFVKIGAQQLPNLNQKYDHCTSPLWKGKSAEHVTLNYKQLSADKMKIYNNGSEKYCAEL
jgi:hypothetical protein